LKRKELKLGYQNGEEFALSVSTLKRHFACFGSSGSGKTVASKVMIEELSRAGIPIIAFDPQGDIASLSKVANKDEILNKNIKSSIYDSFNENVEVVIWTPGSSKGLPLCINPLNFDNVDIGNNESSERHFSLVAKNISSLVGYESSSDDCKSIEGVLVLTFNWCKDNNSFPSNFKELISILSNIPRSLNESIESICEKRLLRSLVKKLNLMTIGTKSLIFENGVPATIDTLLGKDGSSNKTRISVIYLNSLQSSEEKEFFISSICQLLYNWMIHNPIKDNDIDLQCALFIDEVAPYIPPVRKPACKESLELLFRQGRKYGISCLVATQSPGDIDYKCIGQFSTFLLGTLNTKQDIDKVKKRMESVAPKEIGLIVKQLPSLNSGNFLAISPDELDGVKQMQVRWLITSHKVVPENRIKGLNPVIVSDFYANLSFGSNNNSQQDKIKRPSKTIATKAKPKTIEKDDFILVARNLIKERRIEKYLKPFLKGTLFKSEKLVESTFEYYPLLQISIIFFDKKGFFRRTTVEIPENLYIDYKTHKMLYIEKEEFFFKSVVEDDPHKILDLDDNCKIETIKKNEIDFDFRKLRSKKLDKKKIYNTMERKYNIKVNDDKILLFPIWKCLVEEKSSSSNRFVYLDGIFGNEINLP